eukprot:scaffold766_cov210-Alexandrium_tamarense.AAC.10
MGGKSSNLVAHAFGGGDGDFVNDTLVGVEVEGEAGVVLLDDGTCGFLDGFGADSLETYCLSREEARGCRSTSMECSNRRLKWKRSETRRRHSPVNLMLSNKDVHSRIRENERTGGHAAYTLRITSPARRRAHHANDSAPLSQPSAYSRVRIPE